MISERQFAHGFDGFWSELLPRLTPGFVHTFNDAYCWKLSDSQNLEVPLSEENHHPAIVAEMAFHLARLSWQSKQDCARAVVSKTLIKKSEMLALRLIAEFENDEFDDASLNEAERMEAVELAANYFTFFKCFNSGAKVEFFPKIRGLGFIDACCGDLAIGDTLIEVKTVDRIISGRDLRQLIVYLGLQAATGKRRWENAAFFNPRRALGFSFSVDNLVYHLSGGRSGPDVFQDFREYLTGTDAQFDKRF